MGNKNKKIWLMGVVFLGVFYFFHSPVQAQTGGCTSPGNICSLGATAPGDPGTCSNDLDCKLKRCGIRNTAPYLEECYSFLWQSDTYPLWAPINYGRIGSFQRGEGCENYTFHAVGSFCRYQGIGGSCQLDCSNRAIRCSSDPNFQCDRPPTAPSLIATPDSARREVSLFWSGASDDIAIVQYRIYRNGSLIRSISSNGSSGSYVDSGLADGSYTYVVTVVDSSLQTANSNSQSVVLDANPPTMPPNFSATATGSNSISLSWGASTDVVGVTGYQLIIFQGGSELGRITLAASARNHAYDTLLANTDYSFELRAVDASGNLSAPANASATTFPQNDCQGRAAGDVCTTTAGNPGTCGYVSGGILQCVDNPPTVSDNQPPTNPTNLVATPLSTTSIQASWSPSTDNSGIVWYEVYVDGELAVLTQQTTYTAIGLTPGYIYEFQVRARDAADPVNYSGFAGPVQAETLTEATEPITEPIVDPGGGSGTIGLPVEDPAINLPSSPTFSNIFQRIVTWILAIFGLLAILAFLISGTQYVLSGGSEKVVETAKRNMTWAIVGIVIALGSWIILRTIDMALHATPII